MPRGPKEAKYEVTLLEYTDVLDRAFAVTHGEWALPEEVEYKDTFLKIPQITDRFISVPLPHERVAA